MFAEKIRYTLVYSKDSDYIRVAPNNYSIEQTAKFLEFAPEVYQVLKRIASCEFHVHGDVVDIAQQAIKKLGGN